MGKRGPKPQYIDTNWTPELAYVIGIFASDGNLGKDGAYLNVTSKDKIVLANVLMVLDKNHIRIGTKRGSFTGSTTAFCIQLKSVILHSWFVSIGLTPDKSRTIGELAVPDEYFFSFLRGVWDGDGSMYAYWDPRWRSSYMYYLQFASGSIAFLSWLHQTIERLIGVTGKLDTSNPRFAQLRFAKAGSRRVFNSMFQNSGDLYLPRKFTKAQKIFKIGERNSEYWSYS